MVTLRVNTEHELEVAMGKLNFLQGQLQTEQHTKTALEETYQVELEENRKELGEKECGGSIASRRNLYSEEGDAMLIDSNTHCSHGNKQKEIMLDQENMNVSGWKKGLDKKNIKCDMNQKKW